MQQPNIKVYMRSIPKRNALGGGGTALNMKPRTDLINPRLTTKPLSWWRVCCLFCCSLSIWWREPPSVVVVRALGPNNGTEPHPQELRAICARATSSWISSRTAPTQKLNGNLALSLLPRYACTGLYRAANTQHILFLIYTWYGTNKYFDCAD